MRRLSLNQRIIGVSMILMVLISLPGCASAPRHQATVASGTVYNALAAVQDTEALLHTSGQITDAQHQAFARELVKALEAGRAFNAAVMAWPKGDATVPPTLKQTVDNIFVSTNAALAALPLGPAKDALAQRVLAVAQVVTAVLLNR